MTGNGTWGYFIFSVLKRGMFGPHLHCSQLAIQDLRLIGLRAGDYKVLSAYTGREEQRFRRGWKTIWDFRIAAMKEYNCFQSAAWQTELENFRTQQAATDLHMLFGDIDWIVTDYLKPRIEGNEFLL